MLEWHFIIKLIPISTFPFLIPLPVRSKRCVHTLLKYVFFWFPQSVCMWSLLLLRLLLVFILVFTNKVLKFNQSLLATLFVNSDYHCHLFILFSCQLMFCVGGGQWGGGGESCTCCFCCTHMIVDLTSSLNGWTSCASAFLIITCFVVLLQLITVCTVHDVCVDSQHT